MQHIQGTKDMYPEYINNNKKKRWLGNLDKTCRGDTVLEFESGQVQGVGGGLGTVWAFHRSVITKHKTNSAQIQGDLPVIKLPARTKITFR